MIKKIVIILVLGMVLFQGTAFAVETGGDVVFKDAMYGAVIGAIIGGAVYLVDDDNLAQKLGVGVGIGTLGGLIYGLSETRSLVSIEKDGDVKFALPTPMIRKTEKDTKYAVSLMKIDF